MPGNADAVINPTVLPVGDRGILVRFSGSLDDGANLRANTLARILQDSVIGGVDEVVPNLVSVLVRYNPVKVSYQSLSAELSLVLSRSDADAAPVTNHTVETHFGGASGPDLEEVADTLGMSPGAFVSAHCSSRLRVLATGFAPGFVYCGFHDPALEVPRRTQIRQMVPAGSVLFAAGQTAITSTPIPTGWNLIGHTTLRNFDPQYAPPTRLRAGDGIRFEAVS